MRWLIYYIFKYYDTEWYVKVFLPWHNIFFAVTNRLLCLSFSYYSEIDPFHISGCLRIESNQSWVYFYSDEGKRTANTIFTFPFDKMVAFSWLSKRCNKKKTDYFRRKEKWPIYCYSLNYCIRNSLAAVLTFFWNILPNYCIVKCLRLAKNCKMLFLKVISFVQGFIYLKSPCSQ